MKKHCLRTVLFLTMGDYRESNPDRELHKLACYRYTIATINFIFIPQI